MASVIVDGKETQLARPTEGVDIFEGKVAVPAKYGFTVEINKVAYGFAPYSGNGGVGKVENMMSAAPYYLSLIHISLHGDVLHGSTSDHLLRKA